MNNIFENARFGQSFKTKNGQVAVLVSLFDDSAYLLTEHKLNNKRFVHYTYEYRLDGICKECEELDIVSEWEEEINKEELDELLAEQNYPYPSHNKSDMCVTHSSDGFNEGFIDEYSNAK